MQQSPIFLKGYETLVWILNHTEKFPRAQRFVMAKRIQEAALGFYDDLVWASKSKARRREALSRADYHLERLRIYNRLAMEMKLSSMKQYEHLAERLDELGRLLGGWQRSSAGA